MMESALVWFRRDLRCEDHAVLAHALSRFGRVYCAFVFDREILDRLLSRGRCADRRIEFILGCVDELDAALRAQGGALIVRHGWARSEIPALSAELNVAAVFANRDYEPQALARDAEVARRLAADGRAFVDVKDQVIFERDEVTTQSGTAYTVFTPYANAWRRRLDAASVAPLAVAARPGQLAAPELAPRRPDLQGLGFVPADASRSGPAAGMSGAGMLFASFARRIEHYARTRDDLVPAGTSGLSAHLRFGTISVRRCVRLALEHPGAGAQAWLTELIWREFFQMILWWYPRVVDHAFRGAMDAIVWEDDPAGLAAWREGRTGYPLVDAAMRELRDCGTMHNRVRMLVASFLVKDLGIDWRLGEAHFAEWLLDYDLAANNGNWQWVASTGCDAQPWFRIFNPVAQSRKFDARGAYIRRHVPELAPLPDRHIHAPWLMSDADSRACGVRIGRDYPPPILDHASARVKALARHRKIRR